MIRQHPRSIDASQLPGDGFGVASPTWWGTLGFMFIEGSTLLVCAMAYIYLSRRSPLWPPSGTPAPSLAVGTVFTGAMLLSLIPSWLLGRAAKSLDRGRVIFWASVGLVVEAVMVAIRAYELHALPFRWDGSAYGSSVWITMGTHTTLLAFDFGETLVFLALFLWAPIQKKHFADVSDAVMYWFFVVLVWVPLYYMIYVSPRIF
ncbi:MAG: heme-copper oxidase subunit III [Gemmatimonadales bacterium]